MVRVLPGALDRERQNALLAAVRAVAAAAPYFRPTMPGSGRAFSVEMTNCGRVGWVSDQAGYRYQDSHPVTGARWPALPPDFLDLWHDFTTETAPPDCVLINRYDAMARMGLHQDRDEIDLAAPVVSVSLGDRALFRVGGHARRDPTRSVWLSSGDVVVLEGDSRLSFHGIDRVSAGTSTLIPGGGRINLTLRRVWPPHETVDIDSDRDQRFRRRP